MLLSRRTKLRRGLSVIEMLVAVSVFASVGIFVSFLTIEIARMARSSLDLIPAELTAYRTVDRARAELLPASSRNIFIDPDGVTFTNPARGNQMNGGARMRIWLEEDGTCMFDADINSTAVAPVEIGREIENLRFQLVGDRRIAIEVTTFAVASTITTARERNTTYRDVITLRN